jgi:uncharacterized protein YyaL (SSP411 family)
MKALHSLSQGLELRVTTRVDKTACFTVGGKYGRDSENAQDQDYFTRETQFEFQVRTAQEALFLIAEIKPLPQMSIELSGRWDRYRYNDQKPLRAKPGRWHQPGCHSFRVRIHLPIPEPALYSFLWWSDDRSRNFINQPPLLKIPKVEPKPSPGSRCRMPNRLIHEKSPYLLQHAHNPVDWFPWSEAAFEKARKENKPIFLSIGYATCHWCHVMERESFEDPQAAAALNEAFVPIKVDREERPDIDAVYMAACQMVSGSGGWPLNVMLTPDKKPFFAGTYLPRHTRFGRPGLVEICKQIQTLWKNNPDRVLEAANGITGQLNRAFDFSTGTDQKLDFDIMGQAFAQISRSYDPQYGGFDPAPKFPTPHRLQFLLRHHHRTGNLHALEMVSHTLTAMGQGGLWDHVGFGFHRYSTDARWLLPHFEKMLYDQALSAMAYLEAYQVTGNPLFSLTAGEIFTYVLRDMTDPQGGFYTAEDADSEQEEGRFYVWTFKAFEQIAGPDSRDVPWHRIFNLATDGNFIDEATRKKNGANILHMTRSWAQWAKVLDIPEQTLIGKWGRLRNKLYEHRKRRVAPLKDDKILTDWNGLMIASLALGARILESDTYAAAARKGVAFIRSRLIDHRGCLLHRYRDGQADIAAQAGDFAFLIMGLIELYRTTFQTDLLEFALLLQKEMDARFWDSAQGGYFLITANSNELPVRPKELYDGALPSVNSVALSNLILLSRLTGNQLWDERADKLSHCFAGTVVRRPMAFTHFLNGVDLALRPGNDVVVTGSKAGSDTRAILKALHTTYAPNLVAHLKSEDNAGPLSVLAGFTAGLSCGDGPATAHICTGHHCEKRTTHVDILLKHLLNKG